MHTRFISITNELHCLGEAIPLYNQMRKILGVVPKSRECKVDSIIEARNLKTFTMDELIGNLKTDELKKQQGKEKKEISKTEEQVTKLKSKNQSLVNQLEKVGNANDKGKENAIENKVEDQKLELITLTLQISETEKQVAKLKSSNRSMVSQLEKIDTLNSKRKKEASKLQIEHEEILGDSQKDLMTALHKNDKLERDLIRLTEELSIHPWEQLWKKTDVLHKINDYLKKERDLVLSLKRSDLSSSVEMVAENLILLAYDSKESSVSAKEQIVGKKDDVTMGGETFLPLNEGDDDEPPLRWPVKK
ncbi:intermediate filament protein ifa-2-like [Capsicum annuum]|uniref:intermediate filament protein ifa-2-like n=1 Tax=Capsicum annuum TaxID=4072 RepID=UPI001FB0D503|nr:intermediate filament protein ifa-2-like [Capsicum annuum]